MNQNLFSYGTLQKEKVQLMLFGRILKGSPDILKGYTTAEVEIMDETFLSKGEQNHQLTLVASQNENSEVAGTVLELTNEELLQADSYEPKEYERVKVVLASKREAWIYIYL